MAFVPLYGLNTVLVAPTAAGAGQLQIDNSVAADLQTQLGVGGYSYVSLSDGVNYEIVRVDSITPPYLNVTRGQDGTTTEAFPIGTCLRFVWEAAGIAAVAAGPSVVLTGTGALTATQTGPGAWTLDVPVPVITGVPPMQVMGEYPAWEIAIQATLGGCCCGGTVSGGTSGPITITGSGIANVTGTDPTFNVDVAAPAFIGTSGVTVSGVYPNLTFTGPGVIPGGGVNSVTGSTKILIGGSGANPTVNLIATGVGATTYNGVTYDNWGTATALDPLYKPIVGITTTTPALTILPSGTSIVMNISDATTTAKGLVQLAPATVAGSNNPGDSTSAVTPAGIAAIFSGSGTLSSFSYTPDVAANYTNSLTATITTPNLVAGQSVVITAYAEVFDNALPVGQVPLWGLAVFHGLALVQGVQSTYTGSHTLTFTIVGPSAAQPLNVKTTTLSGTATVPAQSLFGRLG